MAVIGRMMRDRRFHRLALVGCCLAVACGFTAWKAGVDLAMLKAAWKQAELYLAGRPWLLFAALVVLPGLPVPTSALMFLAGTVWRDRPVVACGLCLVAIALNLTWTYWFAARPGRKLIEKIILSNNLRIPQTPLGGDLNFLLLLRLTPGLPLFLQNYLLGFFRVPFRLYLPISLCITGLVSCGVVLSGAGIADGNLKPLLAGVGLIAAGWILLRWLRIRKLSPRRD
jgi:uncharacterized membrane protein YdjX (TVP38/TMEM64 family)